MLLWVDVTDTSLIDSWPSTVDDFVEYVKGRL